MEYLNVKNWDKWQTYRKDRGQPPWIKVHRCLLRNPEWVSLSDAERGQLVSIWLLAADKGGAIPASSSLVQRLCFMETPPNFNKLKELNFLASSGCQVDDIYDAPEAEAKAETETEAEEKHEPFRLPSKEEISEASIPMVKVMIGQVCKELYERGIFTKSNAFANKCLKSKANARAVLHTLIRVFHAKPEKAWGYAVKVMSVEDGNFNERDFRKTA